VTCFVAHMRKKGHFKETGIEVTAGNAKAVEEEIARIVGLEGERCPAIWRETKMWLAEPRKKAMLFDALRKKFGAKS